MSKQIFLRENVTITSVIEELASLGYAPSYFHESEPAPWEIEFHPAQATNTTVHFIQNKQLGVNYLDITGAAAPVVRQALEQVLGHYDSATIYERASGDPDREQRVTALFQLALARLPVPEPHVLRLIGELLHHADDHMRHATVLAIAYFEWPEAVPMLDDLIRRETNQAILDSAQTLRAQCRARPEPCPITGFERVEVRSGPHSETIWGERWPDGRYAVSSIPQVAYNLSLGDTVDVETRDGVTAMTAVRDKLGHRTVRVQIGTELQRAAVESLVRTLSARIETQQPGRAAIDVPPDVDISQLTQGLAAHSVSWEQSDPQLMSN